MPRNSFYAFCSKSHYESNYKSFCPNYKLSNDESKVIFDKEWSDEELKQLENDSAVTVLTHSEAISEVSKSEWQGEEI